MVSDFIGTRGEAIFVQEIMNFCGRPLPYFVAYHLGAKFPTADYLVELVDTDDTTAFFFAQVKTTRQGYGTRKGGRSYLKITVDKDKINRLAHYPAPTYLFGIDEQMAVGYMVAIDKVRQHRISGIPTTFRVDCVNLALLWQEVKAYWDNHTISFTSKFTF